MSKEKDLFDDTTMSFGEHLEELRKRLILALLGLVIGVIISLLYSRPLMLTMELPVKNALIRYHKIINGEVAPPILDLDWLWNSIGWPAKPQEPAQKKQPDAAPQVTSSEVIKTVDVQVDSAELLDALHKIHPSIPAAPANPPPIFLTLKISEKVLKQVLPIRETDLSLVALTAEEAFMVYLKVAFVAGLMLSSPWVFYQLWLFVAAGLYPHERKYVYTYLPLSLTLFFGGAIFCFFAVIPYVLDFLFQFNIWLNITIQPRLTEYVSFIVVLPVMFGISFQLPLVMLFLERISIFDVKAYQDKRRLAILAIAFISMILTPSDPVSMTLMMVPLCILYELGIFLCKWQPAAKQNPFDDGQKGLAKANA